MQDKLNHAKTLIQQKRYAEARQVIKALKHPKEAEWLARIDALEGKLSVATAPPAPLISTKSSKPLPLLPEEEREVLGRKGKPDDPQTILNERVPIRRVRMTMWLFGGKCAPLIFNYFRMRRPVLGAAMLVLYIAWVVAWMLSFALIFVLVGDHNTSIPIFVLILLIVVGLPFTPHLLASVQQDHYEQWLRDFAELRRDYFAKKA